MKWRPLLVTVSVHRVGRLGRRLTTLVAMWTVFQRASSVSHLAQSLRGNDRGRWRLLVRINLHLLLLPYNRLMFQFLLRYHMASSPKRPIINNIRTQLVWYRTCIEKQHAVTTWKIYGEKLHSPSGGNVACQHCWERMVGKFETLLNA